MAVQLVQALERRLFMLHYQLIIGMQGGFIAVAEALLRWQYPT